MPLSTQILLLGDSRLYQVSEEVKKKDTDQISTIVASLHDALMNFRRQYGRGRAIAAPQLGIMKRIMYMCIDTPTVFINPSFTWKSSEMYELWDDCMSFPELLVKVKRHKACRLSFYDQSWHKQEWDLTGDLSELLQHEYDHLDGILATMRAIDGRSFALASQKHLVGFTR